MAELCDILCRLCAAKLTDHQCIDIFGPDGIAARIHEIIVQHFGFEVLICDGNSSRICTQCWSITASFHNLYETVQRCEATLIEHTANTTETIDAEMPDYDSIATNIEYKVEVLDSQTDGHHTSCNADVVSMADEHEEVLVEVIVDDVKQPEVLDEWVETVEADEVEEDLVEEEVDEGADLSDQVNENDANNELEEDDGDENGDDDDDDDDDSDGMDEDDGEDAGVDDADTGTKPTVRRKKRSAADVERIERENEQIRQYYNMNCVLCSDVFGTIHDAVKHYRRRHQQPGYLSCCGKKVYRRCMALDHIQKHLDPDLHRCPQCNKLYTNRSTLRSHMKRHKVTEARPYVCDLCPERYPTPQSLAKHKRLEHNDQGTKEFGCDICGKFFVTKSVLANHVRGVHENAFAHMCHICAKTFKSKQVYDLHQREHLETEPPKLQCSICGNWLKHEHSLRKHMARHGQTEEVCKLCNKVAPNRHALGNHMRYVHSERTYKCTMCEKAFKKPIGLKEHMASHMGVDLYFCPYCPKTFKSNANMHSHRKKKHLAQWQHDRDQRQKP